MALGLDKQPVLNPNQPRRPETALRRIGARDHHRGLSVEAVGHQRRVGLDLALDALLLELHLDAQPLLALTADRASVLELQVDVLSICSAELTQSALNLIALARRIRCGKSSRHGCGGTSGGLTT